MTSTISGRGTWSARMRAGRWVEVGDGVLARRHPELDLTTGLVVGGERALVVDTGGDARQGAELATAVDAVTRLPVTVAITHAHFDHCFGTAAFLRLARRRRWSCPVFAHPRCAAALAATADAQRAEWAAHYRARGDRATADALAATDPSPPDAPAPAVLDLGGRTVELLLPGPGHTDHDLAVHVADAGVLFAGDLVEEGAPPDLGDAVVAAWPGTLDVLLALDPRVVVPGHGEPVDPGFVAAQRTELAAVAALHSAVGAGQIDAATAQARSPYPGVPWPDPS
jgi:glyoxylase-like metal-dependent hydrolase (beta-lactamase superfamily II)